MKPRSTERYQLLPSLKVGHTPIAVFWSNQLCRLIAKTGVLTLSLSVKTYEKSELLELVSNNRDVRINEGKSVRCPYSILKSINNTKDITALR